MYFHGVVNGLADQKVISILKDREISSAAKRNFVNKIGFNEMDYISICEYLGEEVYKKYPNNAFHRYIQNHFCFVISPDIEVEIPVFIENATTMDRFELIRMRTENPDTRFSDIIDERQVKNSIPFDKVVAIGIPYDLKPEDGFIKLSSFIFLTPEEYAQLIANVENIAKDYGIEVINSCTPNFPELIKDSYGRK